MILLLGATTYVGQAFARALRRQTDTFIPLSLGALDYRRFELLFDYVRKIRPDFVINAEEYPGGSDCGTNGSANGPGVATSTLFPSPDHLDATFPSEPADSDRLQIFQTEVLLPQTIARACALTKVPLGHVSSGSIYCGAKISENGLLKTQEDLTQPGTRRLFTQHPEKFLGFTEFDEPNFTFKSPPCTFYSGTKALAEEALRSTDSYIWRLRLPFNEQDEPRNFLSQLQCGLKVQDAINSLSHLDECVVACLELWKRRAPFGIYNVVNPGAVLTSSIVSLIQRVLRPPRLFQFLAYEEESEGPGHQVLRSDCILDHSKLFATGITLRPVNEAIDKALARWQPQTVAALRNRA